MTYSYHRLEGVQLPLFEGVDPYREPTDRRKVLTQSSIEESPTERVLGGDHVEFELWIYGEYRRIQGVAIPLTYPQGSVLVDYEIAISPGKIHQGQVQLLASEVQRQTHRESIEPAIGNNKRGWIEIRKVRRWRKNGDLWECDQAWLHWEEPGSKKRSRYIPKAKIASVEESVYGLLSPLDETLKLLGKAR